MLAGDGTPVLVDFGLARADEVGGDSPSLSGSVTGTPAYMSPEQLRGSARVDRRSDVYSLAATLYEAATLSRPFEAATREELFHAILALDPPDARKRNPAVPADLAVVLATGLEKDRDRRYESALAFAEELRRVRTLEPIRARPATASRASSAAIAIRARSSAASPPARSMPYSANVRSMRSASGRRSSRLRSPYTSVPNSMPSSSS